MKGGGESSLAYSLRWNHLLVVSEAMITKFSVSVLGTDFYLINWHEKLCTPDYSEPIVMSLAD
jgi:hypothetical protein